MEFIESFMKFSFSDDDIFRIEEDELVKDVSRARKRAMRLFSDCQSICRTHK
jgi:hypothetical protein